MHIIILSLKKKRKNRNTPWEAMGVYRKILADCKAIDFLRKKNVVMYEHSRFDGLEWTRLLTPSSFLEDRWYPKKTYVSQLLTSLIPQNDMYTIFYKILLPTTWFLVVFPPLVQVNLFAVGSKTLLEEEVVDAVMTDLIFNYIETVHLSGFIARIWISHCLLSRLWILTLWTEWPVFSLVTVIFFYIFLDENDDTV